MDKGIYTALSGAVANEKQLEVTANNVANVDTVGFKKNTPLFKEYLTNLEKQETVIDVPRDEFKPTDYYHLNGNERSYVSTNGIATDYTKGTFKLTSNPLDMAIVGEGFFEIATPFGTRYTQAGNFNLNAEGKLVTTEGYPVLAESKNEAEGEAFRAPASMNTEDPKSREISIGNNQISVRSDGSILANNQVIAKLGLVEFLDKSKLSKTGSNLFVANSDALINKDKTSSVIQGYIEGSNVNPTAEMVSLIGTQRTFDGLNKAINTYSEMATKAIELSDVSR